MNKATINIIGACTSRDIFGITNMDNDDDPDSYNIQSYIWNISPFFLFDKNFNIDFNKFIEYREKYKKDLKTTISNFGALRVFSSLKKNIFETSDFNNCEFLIIDNFFSSLQYYELEDGTIITRTDDSILNYLIRNNVVPKIINKFEFEDISAAIKREMIKKFCLKIKENIEEENIIIIEYFPANLIFNDKYKHFGTFFEPQIYKKLIDKYKWSASILKENLKKAKYISPPAVSISDANHKWGQHIVHFLPEYYFNYYLPIIDFHSSKKNITNNNNQVNLQNIKSSFDNLIIERYGKEIKKFNLNIFNNSYKKNRTYEILSYHNFKILFNSKNNSITNYKIIKPGFYPIYSKINNNCFLMYIIINNKIFYFKEITFFAKVILTENQIWLDSVIYNKDNTISLNLYDKFLSFRPNGETCLMPWNREWEHIKLQEI